MIAKAKTSKSLVFLQFAILSFISLWAASEFAAYRWSFNSVLGAQFHGIYWPWSIIRWGIAWPQQFEAVIKPAMSIGVFVLSFGTLLLLQVQTQSKKRALQKSLHGSARWATEKDIRRAGLLNQKEGVYIGAWQDSKGKTHYLRHNGPEHILTYAPTRSGKGVGLVIPTLLSWKHSAVITDLKGELWAMTAGWRKEYAHNKVLRFEPAAIEGSIRWNPLNEIRLGTANEIGDAQNLAMLIVDPDGKGLDDHWRKTAFSLAVGVILHALYKTRGTSTEASLPYVDHLLADTETPPMELYREMSDYPHLNGKPHPVVAACGQDMLNRGSEEADSILSTLKSYLSLYRDPIVANNVSCSEFFIKDLMNDAHPVSLYIVTQPADKMRLQPIVRIMINMVLRILADKVEFERSDTDGMLRQKKTYKHRLLGMIDEFPSIGKLDILQESMAFIAGYGIKLYLICQDINQLKSRERGYGPDETITSNCHIQNAYPPNRQETAEHLSKLTGETTIIKEQTTRSGSPWSFMSRNVSHSSQETRRFLLTPNECTSMPGPEKNDKGEITKAGDMLIRVTGFPMIYGKQPLYFQDPTFIARAGVCAPETTDIIREPKKTRIEL